MNSIAGGHRYDGKHSYEDTIMPVEEVYERWNKGNAIWGGMNEDVLAHAGEVKINAR